METLVGILFLIAIVVYILRDRDFANYAITLLAWVGGIGAIFIVGIIIFPEITENYAVILGSIVVIGWTSFIIFLSPGKRLCERLTEYIHGPSPAKINLLERERKESLRKEEQIRRQILVEQQRREKRRKEQHDLSSKLKNGIYILSNPHYTGLLKIGYTTRHVEKRIQELSTPTGVPAPFKLEAFFYSPNPKRDEARIHKVLRSKRIRGSEFFKIKIDEAIKQCRDMIGDGVRVDPVSLLLVPMMSTQSSNDLGKRDQIPNTFRMASDSSSQVVSRICPSCQMKLTDSNMNKNEFYCHLCRVTYTVTYLMKGVSVMQVKED